MISNHFGTILKPFLETGLTHLLSSYTCVSFYKDTFKTFFWELHKADRSTLYTIL